MLQTSDGGYIAGGSSRSGLSFDKTVAGKGGHDYWLVKLDASGVIEWQKDFGGSENDYLEAMVKTTDGGYILAGTSLSGLSGDKTEINKGAEDYWIVKTDAAGVPEWQSTIGGSGYDRANDIWQTSDGGYILGGTSGSGISGDKTEISSEGDFWIVKLNSSGGIEWQNTIGGTATDNLFSIQQTNDSGYLVGGSSISSATKDKTEACQGGYDFWILKLNAEGNILWQNTLGGIANDYPFLTRELSDGSIINFGSSQSGISGDKSQICLGGYDYWVVHLLVPDMPECETAPAGLFADNITTTKAKLHWTAVADAVKYKIQFRVSATASWTTVNTTANLKTLAGLSANTAYDYRVRSQCSGGVTSPWSDIETFTTLPLRENVNGEWSGVNIYPNPSNGTFIIQFSELNDDENIFIYIKNILGEEIYVEEINTSELNHEINLNKNIAGGIYFVELKTSDTIYSQQIIITK